MCEKLDSLIINDFLSNNIVERRVVCTRSRTFSDDNISMVRKIKVGELYTVTTGFKKHPSWRDVVHIKEIDKYWYSSSFDLLELESFYIGL